MAYHFFTEPLKLATQTANQVYGAIDINQYRLGQIFSPNVSGIPKAFAVADGSVLVQKIPATNKYSLILKPTEQPDLDLPKISYIIYKGLKEDSLVSGGNVAARTTTDLTRIVYENADRWNSAHGLTVPATNIAAPMGLGLAYDVAATEPAYNKGNAAFIDEAFYSDNDLTLPSVSGGNYLGDFDGDFSITIIFEKIGYRPTFGMAREFDSLLTFPSLSSPTAAQAFERKHKKEAILSFIDPAAFFGAFYGSSLKVFTGSGFEDKNGDPLYTEVIAKFLNANRLYFDIRNEYEDSFNYYNNYDNNISLSLDNTDALVSINYYRNFGWPLLVIPDTEFSVASGADKVMRLALPNPSHDNEFPLIYLRRAYRSESGTATLPQNNDKFLTPITDDDVNAVNMIRLNRHLVFPRTGNTIFTNYFQIKYIKRTKVDDDQNNNDESHNPAGRALFKRTYLDNLFPVFDMDLPFPNNGQTNLKVYYDVTHIDKLLVKDISQAEITGGYTLRDYTSSIGIAKDSATVTFISFPFLYNNNMVYNNDVLPLSGMEAGDNPFLIELNNLFSSVDLVRSTFQDNGTVIEYLRFANNATSPGSTFTPTNYSFRDVLMFSITMQQYSDLQAIRATEFAGDYKVYLGIKDITPILYNGNQYYSFHLVLRGLHEINNDVRPHFYDTNIIAYTDEDILGLDSGHVFPIANAYIEEDYGERNGRHRGIDIEARTDQLTPGAPIYAARGGTVEKIVKRANLLHHGGGDKDPAGIRTRILGDNGYYYYYFHMAPNSNDAFNVNDVITAGQQIGAIGLSGHGYDINDSAHNPGTDTGTVIYSQYHMHFEIWRSTSPMVKLSPYTVFPELALLPFDTDRGA